ncbi:MAG: hypothetical protein ACI35O_03190, partial [Bacillaceae bacterium]
MVETVRLVQEGFAIINTELYAYCIVSLTNKDEWRGFIVRLLTILIILFLVLFLVEKITEKFLGIKRKDISKTPGKSIDR